MNENEWNVHLEIFSRPQAEENSIEKFISWLLNSALECKRNCTNHEAMCAICIFLPVFTFVFKLFTCKQATH